MSRRGWIGVDLDGTLARYDGWKGCEHIGPPVPAMVERIKAWRAQGVEVRVVTARATLDQHEEERAAFVQAFQDWCREHLGEVPPLTCSKDYQMIELWDDRAVQVVPNTGRRADGKA